MSSRLSGLYNAYAAAAGLSPPSSGNPTSRTALSAAGSLAAALASASAAAEGSGPSGGASIEDEDVKPTLDALAADLAAGSSGAGQASASSAPKARSDKLSRRRSARLGGKDSETGAPSTSAAATGEASAAAGEDEEAEPSSSMDAAERLRALLAHGDLQMDDDFGDDDEDDEFDQEVGSHIALLLDAARRVLIPSPFARYSDV